MNGYDYRHASAVETTTLNVVYKDWHQSTYLNDTHGISSVCAYRIKKKFFDFNPFSPEFTIVTFIHYKPRIAAAILDW